VSSASRSNLILSVLRDEETRVSLLVQLARRHDVSLGIVLTETRSGVSIQTDVLKPEVRHFRQKAVQESLNRHDPLSTRVDGWQLDDAVVGTKGRGGLGVLDR
jgi:hypothetical protein